MIGSSNSADYKNFNGTFCNFSFIQTHTWTSATTTDLAAYINGPKYFMPLEAFCYIISRSGSIGYSVTISRLVGSSNFFTLVPGNVVGSWAACAPTADGQTRQAVSPGGTLWSRISGSNPSGASNSVTLKIFISGYFR